ncbi:MAG: alkaline phosphatase PhoX, partial [Bacteroidota bacterium]
MKNLYLPLLGLGLAASATAQNFPSLDTTFNTKVVLAPSPFVVTPLFSGGSSNVVKPASLGGGTAPAKQNHDYTGLVKLNDSTEAYLLVNHELSSKDDNLDDGGGMTAFKVKRTGGNWSVDGNFRYVDFKSVVGGTLQNCGGGHTPNDLVVTAEEYPPADNKTLFTGGFRDTADFVIPAGNAFAGTTLKRYENFGWLVAVDPVTGLAKEKYYKMGRLSHEGAWFQKNGKTVYITDDNTPGVFLKFEATVANNYTDGQLYAYKQNTNSESGTWVALPMDLNSLKDARTVALNNGATMFNRLEWVVGAENGRLFITETGRDDVSNLKSYMQSGKNMPAYHLMHQPGIHDGDSTFTDYYGRVLEFVEGTNTMKVFVEGGNAVGDMSKNLSN